VCHHKAPATHVARTTHLIDSRSVNSASLDVAWRLTAEWGAPVRQCVWRSVSGKDGDRWRKERTQALVVGRVNTSAVVNHFDRVQATVLDANVCSSEESEAGGGERRSNI
jgi:hypothetical protein